MSKEIAKEHIWRKDESGVDRLVVAKGHPVPDGVAEPAAKKVDGPPEDKAHRAAHGKAKR